MQTLNILITLFTGLLCAIGFVSVLLKFMPSPRDMDEAEERQDDFTASMRRWQDMKKNTRAGQ